MFNAKATGPNDSFFYYRQNSLEAVRVGDWKLHFRKQGHVIQELYNLREDIGESRNRYDEAPEVVASLEAKADAIREDLGDEALGIVGKGTRPIGHVENARPLTDYRSDHPYMVAMYDLPDMATMSN